MKIGISTACFYPELTENAITRSGRLGFGICEIFVNCASEFNGFLDIFAQRLDERGMNCLSVHPFTSASEFMFFFTGYERRITDELEDYGRHFDFLRALGGKYFIFHGARTSGVKALPTFEEIEVYKRLSDLALSKGIVLTQENVAWCRSSFPDYIAELGQKVDGLGFTLDLKQAKRSGREAGEYLDAMGERLMNIHLSDSNATSSCLLPGQGDVDFPGLFDRLRAQNYSGDIIIEVYSDCFGDDDEIREAREYIERLLGN